MHFEAILSEGFSEVGWLFQSWTCGKAQQYLRCYSVCLWGVSQNGISGHCKQISSPFLIIYEYNDAQIRLCMRFEAILSEGFSEVGCLEKAGHVVRLSSICAAIQVALGGVAKWDLMALQTTSQSISHHL
jgi:hypothetical protein